MLFHHLIDKFYFFSCALLCWLQCCLQHACYLLYHTTFSYISGSVLCFSEAHELSDAARHHLVPPLISNLSLPLLYFSIASFATQKRAGARKTKLSELPKRNESYKGDVTLNKSPHHGMTYIYTTPEGMRALMSPSLCFCLCLTLSFSALQLDVK